MGKTSERCPVCGAPAPTVKTISIPAMPDDAFKGWPLQLVRYQTVCCPVCGHSGERLCLIGRTRWNIPASPG